MLKHFIYFAPALLIAAACSNTNRADVTFTEAADPVALTPEQQAEWTTVPDRLNAAWGDADLRYSRSLVPDTAGIDTLRLTAWRGEREAAQLVIWTPSGAEGVTCEVTDFRSPAGTIPADAANAGFVRYTLADTLYSVGGATILAPDMVDSIKCMNLDPMTTRPVWITVKVPADASAGTYDADVIIASNDKGTASLPISLEVQDRTLPPAAEWGYHLDLWQHPSAVARAHGYRMWSDEHFAALRPVMQKLADAGQKVITATLNRDPWHHQCYDAYEPMIKWTLKSDGTWSYDYTVFDRWVEMMLDLGIDKMINCYSMVPWNCELEWRDEARRSIEVEEAPPGSELFVTLWTPFLADFKQHLAEKGWLGITNIAMDERDPESMDAAARLLAECAPEMGFAIADNHQSYKKYTMMRDVCVSQGQTTDHQDIVDRRAKGFNTTFYVCCGPLYPNTFTYSQPYEGELLGWYGVASDYDGMLRWAYNSWPADPQYDSRFGTWSSGDTYLMYPHERESIRWSRLIDGIENAEKIRILRAEGADMSAVDEVLEEIRTGNINDPSQPWRDVVARGRAAINAASR